MAQYMGYAVLYLTLRRYLMKNRFYSLGNRLGPVDQRRIRLVLAIVTLILFVLGGGAPGAMSGSDGGG